MHLSPFDSSEKSHSVLARAERGSEIPLQVHHSPAKSACKFNFYSENIDEGPGDDKSRVKTGVWINQRSGERISRKL
jgi:hypothetical protein